MYVFVSQEPRLARKLQETATEKPPTPAARRNRSANRRSAAHLDLPRSRTRQKAPRVPEARAAPAQTRTFPPAFGRARRKHQARRSTALQNPTPPRASTKAARKKKKPPPPQPQSPTPPPPAQPSPPS